MRIFCCFYINILLFIHLVFTNASVNQYKSLLEKIAILLNYNSTGLQFLTY